MDTANSKIKKEADSYSVRLFDYIPVNPQMIEQVRRLDGFNDKELAILKQLMADTVSKIKQQFKFEEKVLQDDEALQKFVQTTLKVHQILALVDTKYDTVFPSDPTGSRDKNLSAHFKDVISQMQKNNGLNYVPRERSSDGRVFEHAADCKVLVEMLSRLPGLKSTGNVSGYKPPQKGEASFFIQITDEANPGEKGESQHAELTTKYEQKVMEELGISKDKNIVLKINRSFIELAMAANGKADLYFHAYFWEHYLKHLDLLISVQASGAAKNDVFQNPFMKRLSGLAMTLTKVIVNIRKFPFDEQSYKRFVNEFGKRQLQKKMKHLEEIQRSLFVAQIADDKQGLYWIEKLLIQLMGYNDMSIRDQSIVLLNMLYDGVDWQLLEAFRPTIRCVGQHFIIECLVHKNPKSINTQIFLGLGAPSPIKGSNQSLLTWHKVEQRNIIEEDNIMQKVQINFGKFWKCGFYDWRLVSISEDGKLQPMEIVGKPAPCFPHVEDDDEFYEQENQEDDAGSIAQGRFVVHSRGMRDNTFHEVQIDHQDPKVDKTTNQFIQRGTFSDVEQSIPRYADQGISCLYLMGTLERDNYPVSVSSHSTEYRRDDASALACVDRSRVNKMLGGDKGLMGVMRSAKKNQVKIITDCLARISSSRHHRKYKNLLLHYLDEDGRRHICYGTDGQAQKFEDTAMLNYRKMEAWELLIDEVVEYTQKFGIDGIHLDNGQAWPQIMEPDTEEMQRLDVDGVSCYSTEDYMNGEVVIRNENHGYWNSNNMETYPNPFFVKMAKRLWSINPDFIFIGECWGGFMFEHRQIILARSGIIPRLFRLPVALSAIMGKRLHNDGRLEECSPVETGISIKSWYDESRKFLPEGTILMQSSTSHVLPMPAYLYGKGTWAAIDTLFFMPDLPMTFMGELEGQVYKIGEVATVFQQEQQSVATGNPNELRRTNSQIMKALKDGEELTNASTDQNPDTPPVPEQRRGLPKVRSGVNIAQNYVEAQEGQIIKKEQQFMKSMDPGKGFDLGQIDTHYTHRRQLRKQKMVLRYGELIVLAAKDTQHLHKPEILCYARYALTETLVIATNMSDTTQKFLLDMYNLVPTFKKAYGNNVVVMVRPVLSDDTEPDYFFLREFIEARNVKILPAYRSLMISIKICDDDQFIFKKCLTNSIERTKKNLLAGHSIEDEQISLLFSDCVIHKPHDIHRFANVIGSIQHSFLDKLNVQFRDLYIKNSKLINNMEYSSRLIGMCSYLLEHGNGENTASLRAAQSMHDGDKLGPIVFVTPELGKWSTVGGLGVMVDELSFGLAALGQDVWVISPYYHHNKKGHTDYLHPDGIHHKDSMFVDVSGGVEIGVHEGTVKGVKLVFLHNGDVFPSPYPDNGPVFATHQVSVFNKACLQYFCNRGNIPAIVVTNDWFTGFCAAYGKMGHFGDTFKGTTFLHICHNLQESYEGRIYLDPEHGNLDHVHQLPTDVIIDGNWQKKMINPSRCAIMCSDQWATVSKSYREDLLNSSSLAGFLRQKPQPFAFPNGIPIAERLKKLDAVAPDHLTAKKLLQQKYFHFGELDDSVPIFAFVGRITSQKGVHLILDVAEHLIHMFEHKIQFLVGGPASMKEPYAAGCANRMWQLRNAYPHAFWAAPNEFFYDGSLVNRGADFGLMPSLFEPGGIVQHEFFVGSTPVVAFKTGGLKDSVHEFMWDTNEGCGYTFEAHNGGDLISAIDRAVGTFKNKEKYQILRKNAFKATMPGETVSKAWLGEFFRLQGKKYYDFRVVEDLKSKFQPWSPSDYEPISIIQEIFGTEKKRQIYKEIDFGATDGKDDESNEIDAIVSAFDQGAMMKISHSFTMPNRGPRHNSVHLCGSFDNWTVRHEMSFDPFTNCWFFMMHMRPGDEYYFKYIINGDNWVVNDDEPKRMDDGGNLNNHVVFEL